MCTPESKWNGKNIPRLPLGSCCRMPQGKHRAAMSVARCALLALRSETFFKPTIMHWILQDNMFAETGWEEMRACLQRFDIPFSVHKVIPFVGELLPAPALSHTNVICFGSYSMRHVARRLQWTPGVFDLFDMDFVRQLEHWGEHMLNAGSRVSRFAEASFFADQLFVRPVNDCKYFAGKVFTRAEFEDWQHKVVELQLSDGSSLTPDTLIQLSAPIQIYAEYRFWIVKGEIVTQSLYKRGSRVYYASDVDPRFHDFVKARLQEWLPHESLVIDVCDSELGLKIVEINTMNAAGFYAADMQKLVLALEAGYNQL